LLIKNPAATFAVRVEGDSMIGAGILPDDIAIVTAL
jgi:DNA polymerase V